MANQINWQDMVTFSIGDTIKVSQTVKEGQKSRIQDFQGIVIAIRGAGKGKNFIVRKIASGSIGVEKIFPLDTPTVAGIQVIKTGKVRRAKLYYLRNLIGKKATKIKDVFVKKDKTIHPVVVQTSTEDKVAQVSTEEKDEARGPKVKVEPKVEEKKEKKIKKGPKKIVRKERRDRR